jgi:hypothetical protein
VCSAKNILFGRFFFDFLEKIKKKGDQTLFYFAAGGGEIKLDYWLVYI